MEDDDDDMVIVGLIVNKKESVVVLLKNYLFSPPLFFCRLEMSVGAPNGVATKIDLRAVLSFYPSDVLFFFVRHSRHCT